ncbi:alkyl sulfatase C-terminal domain-containing protein [Caballeronia sp. INDeC2]|uniref:alkyl sulfatase C-terminal domain-containing protein n=1 Tax=Caballeronia sp. INDeC2 TaxID=2921747 RepID=UPI0020285EF9|nr:alkyl sulfatase C-terminal domain-containing protein [Caballeronia sp. INDeC2]
MGAPSKPATPTTIALNKQYAEFLSFADAQDFADAQRGLIATLPEPVVIKGQGEFPPAPQSPDTIQAMPLDMFLDYLGIRLNAERAHGKTASFNLVLTDTKESRLLGVENSALHYSEKTSNSVDATVTMTRADLNSIMMSQTNMQKARNGRRRQNRRQ